MKNCIHCFLVVGLLAVRGALADGATADKWGTVTNNVQMSIALKSDENEIKTNQTVKLAIRFRNVSTNKTFWIFNSEIPEELPGLSFVVTSPSGKDTSLTTKLTQSSGRGVRVAPSHIRELEFDLTRLYKFNEVGTYQITAKFGELLGGKSKFEVVSNPLSLGVVSGR